MSFLLQKMFKYPMKRRKKSLVSVFCLLALVYGGFQVVYLEDEYSPLQLMSSVEHEANRLLRFITQVHVQCNSSVSTNNLTHWLICHDATLAVPTDISSAKGIVYSIGPGFETSFEQVIDKNSSYHLHVFSSFGSKKKWESFSNQTSIFQTSIVPNDPSDFARNSFQTQTLNSVQEKLGHKKISILKIDNRMETVHIDELMHYLIEDSFLDRVKELHFVLHLDKVEADDIYSWYRVLYSLFHKSGFRLYHTAASNSLCLQDTIMESCKYFLSWLRDVPPQNFVMYPPAIDGSMEYEQERMMEFLDEMSSRKVHLLPIVVTQPKPVAMTKVNRTSIPQSSMMHFELAEKVVENTHSCTVIFILSVHSVHVKGLERTTCQVLSLTPVLSRDVGTYSFNSISLSTTKARPEEQDLSLEDIHFLLKKTKVNVLMMELGPSWESWGCLLAILNEGIPKDLDELVVQTNIFHHDGKPRPWNLRKKYSAMQQVKAFGFQGIKWSKVPQPNALRFRGSEETMSLNFLKSGHI